MLAATSELATVSRAKMFAGSDVAVGATREASLLHSGLLSPAFAFDPLDAGSPALFLAGASEDRGNFLLRLA